MARIYKRDARGRFASGGSSISSSGSKGKTLKRGRVQLAEARGKVRTAKGKLAAFDPADQTIKSSLSKRAQRGAVTKAEKRLAKVKRTAIIKTRRMTGTISKPKGLKPGALKGKPMGGRTRVSRAEPLTTGGGTLAARSSLTRAKRKLAENPTPAQRGAVTRAKKYAAAARARDTTAKKFGRPANVMRRRDERQVTPPAFRSPKWAKKSEWLKPAAEGGRGGGKERAAKRNDEPVTVRKASTVKGYKLPGKPPSAATTKPSLPSQPKSKPAAKAKTDSKTRIEKSIAGIMDRRVSRSASPEKQFKAFQTQQRAARYLRAASRFAEKNNISLARALRSGPKNSTKPKKKRR